METPFTLSPGGIAFAETDTSYPAFAPWGAVANVYLSLSHGCKVVLAFFVTVNGEPCSEIQCASAERAREVYAQIVREMGGRL